MARPKRPKCLCCGKFFRADPRNARHQKYCSASVCRKASKAASQRAWQTKAENLDYFRGVENVARVQAWRIAHPGYWRRPTGQRAIRPIALQDLFLAQAIDTTRESQELPKDALQDLLSSQPAVLVGFIAQFTGSALQDDIVRSTRRLVELGQDILAGRIGGGHQAGDQPRAGP